MSCVPAHRELQYEVGLLNRKMKEKESEAITPMMSARYAVLFNKYVPSLPPLCCLIANVLRRLHTACYWLA